MIKCKNKQIILTFYGNKKLIVCLLDNTKAYHLIPLKLSCFKAQTSASKIKPKKLLAQGI